MNGIHDIGGMDNIGPIVREENEPIFHADWERRVLAMTFAIMGSGYYRTDEVRSATEQIPPATYLTARYYEKWLYSLEMLMQAKDVLTEEELEAGKSLRDDGFKLPPLPVDKAMYVVANRLPASLDIEMPAKFKVGDKIIAKNNNPYHHTRIPRYIRGRRGVIEQDYGVFPLPDAVAQCAGDQPQHVYNVRFSARELWGEEGDPNGAVYIDLFDDYMDSEN